MAAVSAHVSCIIRPNQLISRSEREDPVAKSDGHMQHYAQRYCRLRFRNVVLAFTCRLRAGFDRQCAKCHSQLSVGGGCAFDAFWNKGVCGLYSWIPFRWFKLNRKNDLT